MGGVYAVIDVAGDIVIDKRPVINTLVTKLWLILTESPGGGLWYIYSLIWIVVAIMFLYDPKRKDSLMALLVLFGVLFFLKPLWKTSAVEIQIIQWTKSMYMSLFSSDRTFAFHGIFYIVGMLLAKQEGNLKKWKLLFVVLLLVCNFAAYYISSLYEMTVLGGLLCQFFRLTVTGCIMWLALDVNFPDALRKSSICNIAREMSTIIYFSHFFLIYLFRFTTKICGINYTDNMTVLCVIAWVVLLLYSWTVVTKKKFNRFKKTMYPI